MDLLHEMEELHLIKVLKKHTETTHPKLSNKYNSIISKQQGEQYNEHIKRMRVEWNK